MEHYSGFLSGENSRMSFEELCFLASRAHWAPGQTSTTYFL